MAHRFLTPRWIFTTLLVIVAVGGMVRLGIWQLDRLDQRRTFNAQVQAQVSAPVLDLNTNPAPDSLLAMEYRPVTVRGEYDPHNEILLRNQVNDTQPGFHLLTPLRITGADQVILVDRGFIPLDQDQPAERAAYVQPGVVTVHGILRLPYVPRFFGVPDPTLAPGQSRLDAWSAINLPRIQRQVPYPLLPVYVEISPGPAQAAGTQPVYPIASASLPDLSEGPHLGYAIQWFSFAAVLALGYPFFVKKQLAAPARPRGKRATARSQQRSV